MRFKNILFTVFYVYGLMALPISSLGQHAHLNAGATDTKAGAALAFVNGSLFEVSSGYIKTLRAAETGKFEGYYVGALTMTALPATPLLGGPDPNASLPGSFIVVEMRQVEGPKGGAFSFWEAGATEPSVSMSSGESGSHRWALSESDASIGSDPFGHVHGRFFTATVPGIYQVTFQLLDISSNGQDDQPIHLPSDPITIQFQAGLYMEIVAMQSHSMRVRFGATAGRTWQVFATELMGKSMHWQPVGDPIDGDDHLHEILDDSQMDTTRYYRIIEWFP